MKWKLSIQHLNIGHRIMLTVAIIVIVLILMACVGYMSGRWEENDDPYWFLASAKSQPVETCITDEETRERIRVIMIEALDEALHDQIKYLFQVWMKDERGQPDRAKVGARAAIKAHQNARKSALEWMPQICAN